MANRNGRVCLLSEGEANAFKNEGIKPDCRVHDHVTPDEAFDMTAPVFTRKNGNADRPCAAWVGPRQITYTEVHEWKTVRKSHIPGVGTVRLTHKQFVSCSA